MKSKIIKLEITQREYDVIKEALAQLLAAEMLAPQLDEKDFQALTALLRGRI